MINNTNNKSNVSKNTTACNAVSHIQFKISDRTIDEICERIGAIEISEPTLNNDAKENLQKIIYTLSELTPIVNNPVNECNNQCSEIKPCSKNSSEAKTNENKKEYQPPMINEITATIDPQISNFVAKYRSELDFIRQGVENTTAYYFKQAERLFDEFEANPSINFIEELQRLFEQAEGYYASLNRTGNSKYQQLVQEYKKLEATDQNKMVFINGNMYSVHCYCTPIQMKDLEYALQYGDIESFPLKFEIASDMAMYEETPEAIAMVNMFFANIKFKLTRNGRKSEFHSDIWVADNDFVKDNGDDGPVLKLSLFVEAK